MTDSPTRIIDTPVSSSASAHSHHGGRVDIVRAVIARLLSRTLSARGSDLSQRPDGSDFLTDMISDGAIAEVVGQP